MRALLLPVVSKSEFDSGISLSLVDAAAGLVEVGAKDLLGERDECVSTGDADRLKLATDLSICELAKGQLNVPIDLARIHERPG